jgi:hypothetical protein
MMTRLSPQVQSAEEGWRQRLPRLAFLFVSHGMLIRPWQRQPHGLNRILIHQWLVDASMIL